MCADALRLWDHVLRLGPQTYYLTVDLSHPDFVHKNDQDYVANTRGGYKPWIHVKKPPAPPDAPRPTIEDDDEEDEEEGDNAPHLEAEDDDGEAGAQPGALVRDDEDMSPVPDESDTSPSKKRKRPPAQTTNMPQPAATDSQVGTRRNAAVDADEPEREIQILDLHSRNPIINYRGMIFSGSWAENIGTEMLFTAHAPSPGGNKPPRSSLPALRRLPQDVDLLAASAARLLCRETELRPREDTSARQHDQYREVRRRHGIHISVVGDARGSRRPQARFLENLMALKKIKGEADEATVHPLEPAFADPGDDDVEELALREKRARDAAAAREKRRRRQRRAGTGLGQAMMPSRARGTGRGRGGGWSRARGYKKPWAVMMHASQPMELAVAPADRPAEGQLSAPTPAQWPQVQGSAPRTGVGAGDQGNDPVSAPVGRSRSPTGGQDDAGA